MNEKFLGSALSMKSNLHAPRVEWFIIGRANLSQ